jgi:hypothetical protein
MKILVRWALPTLHWAAMGKFWKQKLLKLVTISSTSLAIALLALFPATWQRDLDCFFSDFFL